MVGAFGGGGGRGNACSVPYSLGILPLGACCLPLLLACAGGIHLSGRHASVFEHFMPLL